MTNILSSLNPKQKEAVTIMRGPVLVIAGPGSGKTRCLTHRIAHLIEQGVAPNNILAVTFTNKAAQEMRERVAQLTKSRPARNASHSEAGKSDIGTFHATCLQILRHQIDKIGYQKNFTIYDDTDQLALIKQITKNLQISPDQFKPNTIKETISRAKDELIDWSIYQEQAHEYFPKTIAQLYQLYQESLKKANALDFDDLIMLTVRLFEKHPQILEKYQDKWPFILIDEAHDTNLSQYTLTNLLAQKHKNLWLIADPDQCLPGQTKINTPKGLKRIDQLKIGDQIIAAGGRNQTCEALITRINKNKYSGDLIKIHTKNKNTLTLTPNHIIFLRLSLNSNIYYTYLMFRKDKGYRIGVAKGKRKELRGTEQIGLLVRTNQEKADKVWILKVCYSRNEAAYWESYYSFNYGIPTIVFFTDGRKMKFTQELIDKLYKNIDTEKRAHELMDDLYFNRDYPHFSPQGVSKKNESKRIKMRVTMFSDNRKTITSPWGLSRVSINTSDLKLKKIIEKLGFSVRKGKSKDWVTEIARVDYGEIEKIAKEIKKADNRLDVLRTALLTENKRYLFQPAGQAHPTMIIPIEKNGKIIEDEIIKVEKIKYKGDVYDLDVKNVHNYIASGFVVHNSIYSWRGADFRNILNFEKDYPQAKIILLEQNYRSTQNILEASHHIITKNSQRKDKRLWTENQAGSLINIIQAENEEEEGAFLIKEIENLMCQGYNLKDFTVLYRTNAQSRAVEEAFLKANLPYKIIGTVRFYDRKEIKDLLAYLKLIDNPDDLISCQRIINTPPRRLPKFAKNINGLFLINDHSEPLQNFYSLIDSFRQAKQKKSLTDLIKFIIKKTDYEKYIKKDDQEGEYRWENIQELFTVANKYNQAGLEKFLEEITLLSSPDEIEMNKNLVNLMTMHCAKGLEFPIVFLVGCEDGIFPHSRSFFDPGQMEEERRLCYVGITRAKEKAYLIFTLRRRLWGQTMINPPSRFLGDIPDHLIEFREHI
ncbi:UvrD-helicase domain-containing protein [Patescibacteria group bacterium]|nr:UvrD-helicase domain-containing protein [Patescibacteria group bacterium]MBU1563940.1 UvrD-helicase domain-containing protein [Patescibacteria group bacterium]